jgi:hypothetical protein
MELLINIDGTEYLIFELLATESSLPKLSLSVKEFDGIIQKVSGYQKSFGVEGFCYITALIPSHKAKAFSDEMR